MFFFKKNDPFVYNKISPENKFYRLPLFILLSSNETYTKCLNFEPNKVTQIKKMTAKQSATNLIPAKSKSPIWKLSNERLKVTLQHYRIENKASKLKIDELLLEFERSSMKVSAELSEDLVFIVSNAQCHHEFLLGGAARILEKFIKGNQIRPNDNQVLYFISIKIGSCLWWDTVQC